MADRILSGDNGQPARSVQSKIYAPRSSDNPITTGGGADVHEPGGSTRCISPSD